MERPVPQYMPPVSVIRPLARFFTVFFLYFGGITSGGTGGLRFLAADFFRFAAIFQIPSPETCLGGS